MFDLNLLPINRIDSRDQSSLPGLVGSTPPRRTARGRSDDQLIILLALTGNAPLAPEGLKQLLDTLTKTYYQTSGSVTSALRAVAEKLNQYLLDRNLRNTSTGRQATALINLAVVHGGLLYLAHGGAAHSFILSVSGVQHLYDPQTVGRGLGLGSSLVLRYYQVQVQPGEYLILSPEPPATWTTNLLDGSTALPIEMISRRLLNQAPPNLSAVLVQFQSGSGKINFVRPVTGLPEMAPPALEKMPAPSPAPEPLLPQETALPAAAPFEEPVQAENTYEEFPAVKSTVPDLTTPPRETTPTPAVEPAPAAPQQTAAASLSNQTAPEPAPTAATLRRPVPERRSRPAVPPAAPALRSTASQAKPPAAQKQPFLMGFAKFWQKGAHAQAKVDRTAQSWFSRLLPGAAGQPGSLSTGSMLFISLAVPLIVVTLAAMVYFQRGRESEFNELFAQAQVAASQTQNQSDPAAQRSAWEKTIYWLDKAENYQTTTASQSLRQQAQQSLDRLDSVYRLNFQPAIIGGLASSVQVSQMVATPTDLYMLDATDGKVIRAQLTSHGYEVDPAFTCQPGVSGSVTINPLVDIAPMPKGNEFKATILGVDGAGILVFCIPGEEPLSAPLAKASDSSWGKITAITYDSNNLYVMDSANNEVWIYAGGTAAFRDAPYSFFDEQIPSIADAVDLAVNSSDLYLLHADGHLTLCTLSYMQGSPTRCTDPAVYSDLRPGRQNGVATLPNTKFTQMLFTPPPDPSIYLLDQAERSVYHFSMRLNLQRLLLPANPADEGIPDTPVTAFTISSTRTIFLAFGNKVFYAMMP
ncbi:MAG: hypothetical protein M1281_08120 [Chloroflexi bacterium]|nr:hypothetical protein [Chloroflexota bacterium]